MRKILLIGHHFGLNGCQMITLQTANIVLLKAGVEIETEIHELSNLTQKPSQTFSAIIDELGSVTNPLKKVFHSSDKNQRYIRQQQKLAQRHFRRK